jgi:hypothetical protein
MSVLKVEPAAEARMTAAATAALTATIRSPAARQRMARAFGRAMAVTPPGSEHGRLLVAALRSPKGPGRPLPVQVAAWLAGRGTSPTPAAIEGRIREVTGSAERRTRLLASLDGAAAAAFVAAFWAEHGQGPTWAEVARAMGWPRNSAELAIPQLARQGWLTPGGRDEPRSLQAGPQATAGRSAA